MLKIQKAVKMYGGGCTDLEMLKYIKKKFNQLITRNETITDEKN